ncbi:MAG: hypothetical protein FWC68_02025 [Oscillospiraceae bacterium]|nr:hypothetical protein [Oscillospiraceae bacterium]
MEELELKQYYKDLKMPDEFMALHKNKNLHTAKQIVEEYDFGREITNEEKRAIIQGMLNHSAFTKKVTTNLERVINNLNVKGVLSQQEIYQIIIYLSVNGGIDRHGYSWMLYSSKNVAGFVEYYIENKKKLDLRITETTIQRAIADNLGEKEREELVRYYIDLGVPEEFVQAKDIRNLCSAKQIVEGYDFRRELASEEKSAILQCILKHSHLDTKRSTRRYLSLVMQSLEKAGYSEQDRCGIVINLGIGKKIVLQQPGYNYSDLLRSKGKCLELKKYADEIDSEVTENSIRKAKEKGPEVVWKAVGKLGRQGELASILQTREELTALTPRENEGHPDSTK